MISKRFFLFILLILLVSAAGWWLGGISIPKSDLLNTTPDVTTQKQILAPTTLNDNQLTWFYIGTGPQASQPIIEKELEWASESGIRNIILTVPATTSNELTPIMKVLLPALHPSKRLILDIDLNQSTDNRFDLEYAWKHVLDIINKVSDVNSDLKIHGIILSYGLHKAWIKPHTSHDEQQYINEFREWLKEIYSTDQALQDSWAKADITLNTATIPSPQDSNIIRWNDYEKFLKLNIAKEIDSLSLSIHRSLPHIEIYAPFRLPAPSDPPSSYPDWTFLRNSSLNGFIFTSLPQDRGLGRTGQPHAPIESALQAGKKWIYLDETHTGIQSTTSDKVTYPPALDTESLIRIYQRNFGQAFIHNGMIAFSDPTGNGNLHHPEFWNAFKEFQKLHPIPYTKDTPYELVLALNTTQNDTNNSQLLHDELRTIQKISLSVNVSTLEELLAPHPPNAPLYIINTPPNLSQESITKLHTLFASREAVVIWISDPNQFQNEDAPTYLSQITGINTELQTGDFNLIARYSVKGHWTELDETYGSDIKSTQRLILNETDADILHKYKDDDAICTVIKAQELDWTSVHIAVPFLSSSALLEIIELLEIPVAASRARTQSHPVSIYQPPYLLLHAPKTEEYFFTLKKPYTVHDLFNVDSRWPNKTALTIPMHMGETRLLFLGQNFPIDKN